MFANGNVECWNDTMVLFVEIIFFALKPKIQCIVWEKLGFFPSLLSYMGHTGGSSLDNVGNPLGDQH